MPPTEKPFSGEWMQRMFRESGAKQTRLVAFLKERGLNVDATKINRSTKGTRELQPEEMPHVWEFFNQDEAALAGAMKERGLIQPSTPSLPMPNAGLPESFRLEAGRLPIRGVSVGGNSQSRVLFNGQVLGFVARPESLADNPRAYATYVHGDSMEPRYEAGILVLVNPDKGYRKGDYVVAQVYDNDGDPPFGYVKKFVSFNGDELVLEQLNPPIPDEKYMHFNRNQVVSVHRIVGTLDE